MDNETLHLPDFGTPDFAQPILQRADLAVPGFRLPDPERPELAELVQTPRWPDMELEQPIAQQPDPALPDLLEPELPVPGLTQPDTLAHALTEPIYTPEVVMQQRPGTLDPAAAAMRLHSVDREDLPPDISYPQLYTSEDEMSARKRHLGMLELGLEDGQ